MPTDHVDELIAAAQAARAHAYAPYSEFKTGAAVRAADGQIYVGALVENLVFGVAMCAERVALFSSVAAGGGSPLMLCVVAPATAGSLTFPCGSCLQVAIELGGPDLMIIASTPDGRRETRTVNELAPGIPRRGDPEGE